MAESNPCDKLHDWCVRQSRLMRSVAVTRHGDQRTSRVQRLTFHDLRQARHIEKPLRNSKTRRRSVGAAGTERLSVGALTTVQSFWYSIPADEVRSVRRMLVQIPQQGPSIRQHADHRKTPHYTLVNLVLYISGNSVLQAGSVRVIQLPLRLIRT